MAFKSCPDCGERVYGLGCVNCNEEAYIAEQERLTWLYETEDRPRSYDAVDPHATDTGKPSTRD